MTLPRAVEFGREICGELAAAEQREWLVTNGIGGFAMGTVAGLLTRRYHGLLVAALDPPRQRTLLVTKFDEVAQYGSETFALGANRWGDGTLDPQGYKRIERFHLDGTTPGWTFACADALLEKRVWMERGANTTYIRYDLIRASRPLELTVKALINYRDFHNTTRGGDWRMNIQPISRGLAVEAFPGATPFYLLSVDAAVQPAHKWYRNFELAAERYRGLDDRDDHLFGGIFRARLEAGKSATLVATTDAAAELDGRVAWDREAGRERDLLERWRQANPVLAASAPEWIRQLVLAADQFIVSHPLEQDPEGRSVIAGYPWFGEWGRDTMIALPGLTLATGRPEIARTILRTFGRLVDRGMLPNYYPETGETPQFNTVDASLWYCEAARQYFAATRDAAFAREIYPILSAIVNAYARGTQFNIHLDPADGLIYAGQPGVQLTWMDAKIGDWVVTPRIGKPIEINALWLNALATLDEIARAAGRPAKEAKAMAERVREGFARFWNPSRGYCFDVLDGPSGDDPTLRPNQIFAASLAESALTPEQQRAVVDVCARKLLTSHGLRSLAPDEPGYCGHYGGARRDRDAAYHQGTVWGWLLGPFALAHWRVYGDPDRAASFLAPMSDHLRSHGLGTASEIFDGDPPFAPRGCIAQAWTVAEVLRAWMEIRSAHAASKPSR